MFQFRIAFSISYTDEKLLCRWLCCLPDKGGKEGGEPIGVNVAFQTKKRVDSAEVGIENLWL